jgi:hypothetical protein
LSSGGPCIAAAAVAAVAAVLVVPEAIAIGIAQFVDDAWKIEAAPAGTAVLVLPAQTAARDWSVPNTLSDTNGSTPAGLLTTGAAETACVESKAAAPAANAQLRIAQNILNPLQPEWGLLPPNRTERKGEDEIADDFLQMTPWCSSQKSADQDCRILRIHACRAEGTDVDVRWELPLERR